MLTAKTLSLSIRRERSHPRVSVWGPGPQNLGSARLNLSIAALLLDATIGAPASPNRFRDLTPITDFTPGTLSVRRRFQNKTGAPVTRLRFRIVDFSSSYARWRHR